MGTRPAFLPDRFIRVVWDAGYGWPVCTHRVRTARNFATAKRAAMQIAAIRAWPSHHRLVGVYMTTDFTWSALDPDTLPSPQEDAGDNTVDEANED